MGHFTWSIFIGKLSNTLIGSRLSCDRKCNGMKGQRMGLIRFGSRCDVYLPKTSEVLVKVGEKVLGGETVLAQIKES